MGNYIPSTESERRKMLDLIGVSSLDALYDDLPSALERKRLDLPGGKSEWEVRARLEALAARNKVFSAIFRGAGAYHHYIPALVKQIPAREEFVTSYTPYQAECSQGVLQSIFEFQTMMCELTGLDVANASVYDGASAAAEAVAMCRERKRLSVLASASSHPMVLSTIDTYCHAVGVEMRVVPVRAGITDADALAAMSEELGDSFSCFYVQQPNYLGLIEDARKLGEIVHARGAKFVMGINPVAAALLETPAECGADIAVGDAQPFGMPLSFGGPYLGFMTATDAMMRKLPGRIVGQTTDVDGRRAFVLTLQAREQHIRRERASSNICSNQALCALTASVYLTVMGPRGLERVASHCYAKAHYAAERMGTLKGFERIYPGAFFHEFVTACPGEPAEVLSRLEENDILGGVPVDGGILWCVTEMNTREQIDRLVEVLRTMKGVA